MPGLLLFYHGLAHYGSEPFNYSVGDINSQWC